MAVGNLLTGGLRYLDAAHVRHGAGSLAGAYVCTAAEPLGALDGVLVEPSSRRLRFYVVTRQDDTGSGRYLVPAGGVSVLDTATCTLRLEDAPPELQKFDDASVEPFSDADMLAALFSKPAA